MEGRSCGPYFDPDFDSVAENINPRVCIDNVTCESCTLVKVDSANRHGILLEMVQLLTDLDLFISKSYISSDGGWLMDVFHVADQLGNKLTDPSLIRYIQQALVRERRGARCTSEVTTCLGKLVGPGHLAAEYPVVEITATDRPGLLSEIAAVLAELHCHVTCAQAWTHSSRAAIVFYLTDEHTRMPIADPDRLAHVEQQVDTVVDAHHLPCERRRVKVLGPIPGRVHTERRLHQLMHEDRDYETGPPPPPADACLDPRRRSVLPFSAAPGIKTRVSIDSWKEKGYSVLYVQSRDRPKLLFDTVCTLTDMQYVIFHAAVGSHGPLAAQEYYVRHIDGCTLDSESERQKVSRCLVAAVERRASHGVRLEISARNRPRLLSDITRVLRENSLSLTRMECATRGERAVATFYVANSSGGGDVDPTKVEAVRKEIGGYGIAVAVGLANCPAALRNSAAAALSAAAVDGRRSNSAPYKAAAVDGRRSNSAPSLKSSLGSLLWSHIERLSGNLGSIRS